LSFFTYYLFTFTSSLNFLSPQQEQPPAMSEEEIQKLREQIEEELRKEMEQNAQACDADDANAQTDSAEPATAPSEGE
jgi:hypothetical protein